MIHNAGFETSAGALQTGHADGWLTETSLFTVGGSIAEFAGDAAAEASAYETFERGWGALNPQSFVTTLLADAVESRFPETFSTWVTNQPYIVIGGAEAAAFDGQTATTETFTKWFADIAYNLAGIVETFDPPTFNTTMPATAAASWGNGSAETFAARENQTVYVDQNSFKRTDGANFVGSQDDRVLLVTNGQLPVGLDEETFYYVMLVNGPYVALSKTPRLPNGQFIYLDDFGLGVHQVQADPDRFWNYVI